MNMWIGILLIAFGIVYQVQPNLFRRGVWKKTSIAQKILSPSAYEKYIRGLGVLYILVGLVLLIHAFNSRAQLAQCVNTKENPDVIINACTYVIESNSRQPQHLLMPLAYRGLVYLNKNNNDKAIQDFNQYLHIQPNDPGVLVNRARALAAKGLEDEAIDDLNNALRLDSNNAAAYAGLIFPYVAKNDFKMAIKNADQAIQRMPDTAGLFYERGIAKIYNNETQAAIDDLETALRLEPSNPYKAIWLHLAYAQLAQDDTKEFEANSVQFLNGKWPAPILAFYQNKISADQVYASAETTDPTTQQEQICEAHFYVGVSYAHKHMNDEARTALTAANKDCPVLYLERSLAQAQLKMIDQ